MAISTRDLIELVETLPENVKQSAYDYLQFLALRHARPDWDEIDRMEPDTLPLSEEEERQLNSNSGFISWEDAKRELGLSTDS